MGVVVVVRAVVVPDLGAEVTDAVAVLEEVLLAVGSGKPDDGRRRWPAGPPWTRYVGCWTRCIPARAGGSTRRLDQRWCRRVCPACSRGQTSDLILVSRSCSR